MIAREWLDQLPHLLLLAALLLVPGALMAYAVGLRGVVAWGVAPCLGMTALTCGTAVAPLLHLPWNPGVLLASGVVGVLVALLCGLALRRKGATPRRSDPVRSRWFAGLGVAGGVLLVLAAVVPGIRSPGELVDSTDAVAHLNRLRRYLDDEVFSSLGTAGHPAYPSGFHDLAGSLAQLVPALADGHGIVVAANLTAILAAAVLWPLGCVALARLALGRSAVVLVGAGLLSAAFTAFPYLLMGWGVLWPNLVAAALLPGVLGPALVPVGILPPVGGARRPVAAVVTVLCLPGLTMTHPNALVALVLVVVLALGTREARRLARAEPAARRRPAGRLAALVVGTVVVLVAAPRLSRQVADTASYDWVSHDPLGVTLRDGVLLGLQQAALPWGLLLVLGAGLVVCWVQPGRRWVVVTWAACLVLFLVAALGWPSFGSLATGYWYNDKVRLAALGALPAVLLATAATRWLAGRLGAVLAGFTPAATPAPAVSRRVSGVAALAVVAVLTGGFSHDAATDLVDRYYHPAYPERVLLTPEEDDALATLSAWIPDGVVTASVPANGSAFLSAYYDKPVLFDSLLLNPDTDANLIGLHLREAASRPDVCAALRRSNVRYAVTAPVRYWLNLGDRTTGIADLDRAPGFEEVGVSGPYRLYRITACGFDPAWVPPAGG